MKVLSVLGGATGSVDLSYTPQFLLFVPTGGTNMPTVINGTILGEGNTINLNSAGAIRVASNNAQFAGLINLGYCIPVADGVLKNKKFNLTVTQGAVNAVDVYAMSFVNGNVPVITQDQTVIALTQQKFTDFLRVMVTGGTANDEINLMASDGSYNNLSGVELSVLSTMSANYPNTLVSGDVGVNYMVDNTHQSYKSFDIKPDTNRIVVVQKFKL